MGDESGAAMKMGKWARFRLAATAALVLIGFMAGCANFWQAPSSSTSTTTSSTSSGVFYVLNQATKQIAGYSIVSGTLTPVTGSPWSLTAAPYSVAIAPGGGFLYVGTATGIYLFTIGTGGALTLADNAPISQDVATAMQVDSTGKWLVESGPGIAELLAVPINPTTGAVTSATEQSIVLPAATVYQLAISPDNTHVFVALGASGTEEAVFAAGNTDPFSNLANIPVVNAAGAAVSVAVDPSNRLIYVGETAATSGTNTGGLRVFNYNTLAEVTGSPYASGGLAPYAILPTPHSTTPGSYIYVANRTVSGNTIGNITGFALTTTGTTYSLTELSTTTSTGTTPISLAQDSSGNFLLVVDSGGDPDLLGFSFDSTTAGKLDAAVSSSTGTDPVEASAVAAAP
jgi:6-phosphogluconolactonase (cycloisomerase 2 family)